MLNSHTIQPLILSIWNLNSNIHSVCSHILFFYFLIHLLHRTCDLTTAATFASKFSKMSACSSYTSRWTTSSWNLSNPVCPFAATFVPTTSSRCPCWKVTCKPAKLSKERKFTPAPSVLSSSATTRTSWWIMRASSTLRFKWNKFFNIWKKV